MRALLAWLCLCVLGIGSAQAKTTAIGILSIETEGASEHVAGQFEVEVEDALRSVGVRSIDRETLHERLLDSDYIQGCTFGPCLSAVRAATGVPIVLVARIEKVGSSYKFVITLIDTKTGIFTSQVAQPCEVCTIEEAIETATLATIALITGTGDAEVSEFSASPASTTDLRSYHKSKPLKQSIRRTGLIFLGAGIIGGGVAGYLWKKDKRTGALIGGAAGTALVTGGATMLILSRRF